MKRKATSQGLASAIGAASALFMASELWRDLTRKARHFNAPKWAKVVVMVALLWLAMQEAAKVHGRLEEVFGG